MVSSIPSGANPGIKNPFEAVALAVHAGFLAVGFRLVGLGEEGRIGKSKSCTRGHGKKERMVSP
jgi:hypothetical protein